MRRSWLWAQRVRTRWSASRTPPGVWTAHCPVGDPSGAGLKEVQLQGPDVVPHVELVAGGVVAQMPQDFVALPQAGGVCRVAALERGSVGRMAGTQEVQPVHNDGRNAAALELAGHSQAGEPRPDDHGGGPLNPAVQRHARHCRVPPRNGASRGGIPRTLTSAWFRSPSGCCSETPVSVQQCLEGYLRFPPVDRGGRTLAVLPDSRRVPRRPLAAETSPKPESRARKRRVNSA